VSDPSIDAVFDLTPQDLQQVIDSIDVQTLIPELKTTLGEVDEQLLERLAVEYGGLTDPIGQLQAWLANQLAAAAAWVVSRISPLIDSAAKAITSWIDTYIKPAIDSIKDAITKVVLPSIEKFAGGVVDFFTKTLPSLYEGAKKTFESWLADVGKLFEGARRAVADVVDSVLRALRTLPSAIGDALKGAVESAQRQLGALASAIGSVFESAKKAFDSWLEGARKTLEGWFSDLGKKWSELVAGAGKAVSDWLEGVRKGFESWVEGVKKALDGIAANLSRRWKEFIDTAGERMGSLIDAAKKTVDGWLESARKGAEEFIKMLENAPATIEKAVKDVEAWVWEHLPPWAKDFLQNAPKALDFVGATLSGFVNGLLKFPEWFPKWFEEHIAKPVSSALESLAKWIWEHIPDWLKGGLEAVKGFFEGLAKGLQDFIKDPIGFIQRGFSWLADQIWKLLPDWLKGAIESIKGFFSWLWESIQGFFKDPWGSIQKAFQELGKWIWDRLPEPVKWFLENAKKALEGAWDAVVKFFTKDLPGFFGWLWEGIQTFIKDPVGALKKGLEWVWNALKGAFDWLAKEAQGFVSWLGDLVGKAGSAVASAGSALLNALTGAAQAAGSAVAGAVAGIAKFGLGDAFAGIAETVANAFGEVFSKFSSKIWERVDKVVRLEEAPASELAEIAMISSFALVAPLGVRVVSHILQAIGRAIGEADIDLRPLGIGIRIPVKPGVILQEVGKYLWYSVEPMTRFFVMSYIAAITQPLGQWTRAMFRDILPTYPIDPATALELARRHMPTEGFEAWREQLRKVLAYSGVPTMFERAFSSKYDEKYVYGVRLAGPRRWEALTTNFYFTIKDRFGAERKVPTSLLYVLPSTSDVARMMVRDLFLTPQDFAKMMEARGMNEDIAKMYYLLHYRYPSPENLWRFYARAMAGALWYTPPPDVAKAAAETAQMLLPPNLAAQYVPKAPTDFNVPFSADPAGTAQKVLSALTTYMKWHDFAPFAWIPGFTADQYIAAELMADLPGRIDVRWMWKWQIPDALAGVAQIPMPSGVSATPSEWVLGQIAIATGLHPRYVPLIVASEMMNALSEERTFYRAGIVTALREGFLDVKIAYEALRKAISFKVTVPVYNPSTMVYEWRQVEVPVVYLDPEVRLMLARSAVDWGTHAIDALRRQLMRMVAINYAKPDEYLPAMQKVAQAVSEAVNKMLDTLGATRVPLTYSEVQAAIDQQLATLRRYEELLRRLRYFVRHSLYSLLQRFAQGYVSEQELDKYINDMAESLKMMDEEKKFFKETALLMRDLAKRQQLEKLIVAKLKRGELKPAEAVSELVKIGWDKETAEAIVYINTKTYVPTISTLATLVELVPEAISMFNRVCDAQGVPEEERKYWLLYIQRKTVKDEVSRLVTELITDYAYGKITDADWNAFMAELKKFGYTDEEIQVLTKIAQLRRLRYAKAK
jgi:phage-related protein